MKKELNEQLQRMQVLAGLITENQEVNELKGRFFDEDQYYTYDHLLPYGTGDDFTPEQFDIMQDAAESDLEKLKEKGIQGIIKQDDMGIPYLDIKN